MALSSSERPATEARSRRIFGLLCGTISIKKAGSCIGDSSVIENEIDGTVPTSPSWRPNPDASAPPANAVLIPSPVLVSKKLAEEAVAKRAVRFRQSNAVEDGIEVDNSTTDHSSSISSNAGSMIVGAPRTRQKRMAPPPPSPAEVRTSS